MPLTSADHPPASESPHNLPEPPTVLIGRERELAAVLDLLLRPHVRLVTLTGPPGSGKTRLALAVAARLLGTFANGVFFVDLAPVHDPGLVVPAIARALGIGDAGRLALCDRLAQQVRGQQVLLVLDNFEQVIEAAPEVSRLLAGCRKLKVLVTSRAALRLRWEHVFAVPPLPLPDSSDFFSLEALAQVPSVALFVERARAARPDFDLDQDNAAAVAEICLRLDGLPLAIELAAARSDAFPPQAILARLQQRLALPVAHTRDLPVRQQTLRAALDWSYELLTPEEKALFRRLAVFVGGCTPEAAGVVCDASAIGIETLEGLASLVDKSLLQLETSGPDGQSLYRMLETVRADALARLLATRSEAEVTARRHADFFLALAEAAEPRLIGPEQQSWLERLEAERANLRCALCAAVERGEAETALRLGAALWRFWQIRGHASEVQRCLEEALALPAAAALPAARARALDTAGELASRQGDYAHAARLHEESLELARQLGDQRGIARALHNLGSVAAARGHYASARALSEQSLALSRSLGVTWGVAETLDTLGRLARDRGDCDRAAALHEESLALSRRLGDQRGIARALHGLGVAKRLQGDRDGSVALHQASLALAYRLGDKGAIAACLESLASVAGARGQPERAARLFGAARALRDMSGTAPRARERAELAHGIADARRALGDAAFAAAWAAGRAQPFHEASACTQAARPPATPGGSGSIQEAPAPPSARSSRRRATDVAGYQVTLTRREQEVMALLADGLTNRQIAEALVIGERTAETHVANLLKKLGVSSRAQLTAWAIDHGLRKGAQQLDASGRRLVAGPLATGDERAGSKGRSAAKRSREKDPYPAS